MFTLIVVFGTVLDMITALHAKFRIQAVPPPGPGTAPIQGAAPPADVAGEAEAHAAVGERGEPHGARARDAVAREGDRYT